jgi:hypothetical protein
MPGKTRRRKTHGGVPEGRYIRGIKSLNSRPRNSFLRKSKKYRPSLYRITNKVRPQNSMIKIVRSTRIIDKTAEEHRKAAEDADTIKTDIFNNIRQIHTMFKNIISMGNNIKYTIEHFNNTRGLEYIEGVNESINEFSNSKKEIKDLLNKIILGHKKLKDNKSISKKVYSKIGNIIDTLKRKMTAFNEEYKEIGKFSYFTLRPLRESLRAAPLNRMNVEVRNYNATASFRNMANAAANASANRRYVNRSNNTNIDDLEALIMGLNVTNRR